MAAERYPASDQLSQLASMIKSCSRLFVLTGAGCSTESGIPDYRDASGAWKGADPVQYQDFLRKPLSRRRYWARSFVGWRRMARAAPNAAHRSLAALEHAGQLGTLVTQNVDGLHSEAGSQKVIDLHGRLRHVTCLNCGDVTTRHEMQERLAELNPGWLGVNASPGPDGDARLTKVDYGSFNIPECLRCGGVLKPDVVFFGESIPRERAAAARDAIDAADGLLVAGSSLMVYSGFRFVRTAASRGIPVAAVNLGTTRADDLIDLKLVAGCSETLSEVARLLA
ncbi:MAG: NAD-dependent protein deacetylase [Pseudomonadota bacterium]